VGGALYLSYLFSYLYLWLVSPEVWAPVAAQLPALGWPAVAGVALLLGLGLMQAAGLLLPAMGRRGFASAGLLVPAGLALLAAPLIDLAGLWESGLRPERDAHGALVYMGTVLNLQVLVAVAVMAGFAAARLLTGTLDREHRVIFEVTRLLAWYGAGQQVFSLLLVHGFPRLLG
jgi:cytochrome c oxidase subunit I+III